MNDSNKEMPDLSEASRSRRNCMRMGAVASSALVASLINVNGASARGAGAPATAGMNVFNVQDYGALGDGSDCTVAIKAAIAAMITENGRAIQGTLYFPSKRAAGSSRIGAIYSISSTIHIGDGTQYIGINIRGDFIPNFDTGITPYIKYTGATGDVFNIRPYPGHDFFCHISDLVIDATSTAAPGAAIHIDSLNYNFYDHFTNLSMRNVVCKGKRETDGGWGFRSTQGLVNPLFHYCYFTGYVGFSIEGEFDNAHWDSCRFRWCDYSHFLIGNSGVLYGSKFTKCLWEYGGSSGDPAGAFSGSFFRIDGHGGGLENPAMANVLFDNCWLEGNGSGHTTPPLFYISPTGCGMYGVTWINNHVAASERTTFVYIDTPTQGQQSRCMALTWINNFISNISAYTDINGSLTSTKYFRDISFYPYAYGPPTGTVKGVWAPERVGGSTDWVVNSVPEKDALHNLYPIYISPKLDSNSVPQYVFGTNRITVANQSGDYADLAVSNVNSSVAQIAVSGSPDGGAGFCGFVLPQYAGNPSTTSFGASQKGFMWFDTTANVVKYWDGSAIKTITGA